MDSPLPKRDYNGPPLRFLTEPEIREKSGRSSSLQWELKKIRRELIELAQRLEKLTTGQETA
jgi:hypothetical protein